MNEETGITALHFGSNNRISFFIIDIVLPSWKHDGNGMRSVCWDGRTDFSRWVYHVDSIV